MSAHQLPHTAGRPRWALWFEALLAQLRQLLHHERLRPGDLLVVRVVRDAPVAPAFGDELEYLLDDLGLLEVYHLLDGGARVGSAVGVAVDLAARDAARLRAAPQFVQSELRRRAPLE